MLEANRHHIAIMDFWQPGNRGKDVFKALKILGALRIIAKQIDGQNTGWCEAIRTRLIKLE